MAKNFTIEDSGPALSREEIEAFESEIGGRLPEDYKEFMLAHNGALFEPTLALPRGDRTETLFGFKQLLPEDTGIRCALRHLREVNPAKVDGYVPIAGTYNGDEICLAHRGRNAGAVFYTEFKYFLADNGDQIPIDVTMVPLADSFTDLLDLLVELPPDPYCQIEDLGKRGTAEDLAKYLAEGNSIDALGNKNLTLLCEAVGFNNMPMIRACIERGASLSGTIKEAVTIKRTHLIEILVRAGADVNEEDEYGDTPLHDVVGTALPGEEGARNRALRDLLIKLGAVGGYEDEEE